MPKGWVEPGTRDMRDDRRSSGESIEKKGPTDFFNSKKNRRESDFFRSVSDYFRPQPHGVTGQLRELFLDIPMLFSASWTVH